MFQFSKLKGIPFFILIGISALIVILNLNMTTPVKKDGINNYIVYLVIVKYNSKDLIIIRKFIQNGKVKYVAVDPDNLQTYLLFQDNLIIRPITWNQLSAQFKKAAYIRALQAARNQSLSLQNSGIIHGSPKLKGVTLTVDLCPSHKPLDRVIFTSLIDEFKKTERPVPVAISITGKFMETHYNDFNWLIKLVRSGDISVTWVNHTFSHRYNPKAPLTKNFLLEPNTDLSFEILETEKALIQQGVIFSIFFRFPGLVSNQKEVSMVTDFGLVPVGSDAWLAKGQPVHSGSIVLIHGNGNEPLGVKDFISLLQTEKSSVMKKQWIMYDLRESIESEFQK